jgi:O-antigen ligase
VQYAFFILLNAILFIRPGDLVESLEPFQLYQLAILGCLATTYPLVIEQLSLEAMMRRPLTLCVVGILSAIVLSQLQFGSIYDARTSGFDFAKILLYFLLLQINVNSAERFQTFLTSTVLFTAVASGLALAQYHQVVDIPALAAYEQREIDEETGDIIVFQRLCGAGIFNDPNDVCLLLMITMMICLYRMMEPGAGPRRFIWLAPALLFLVTFLETKSRGGFIALMVGLNVLIVSRLGVRKAIPLWLLAAPAVLVVFGGRMTKIEVEGGTGQHRIQLWREALGLLREYPLFGVGQGMLPEYTRLVAHNSYVHAFAELGIYGGTLFVGAFYLAISELRKLKSRVDLVPDLELQRLRPYLLGIVAGYGTGILTLSRVYIVPTYMVLGLAAAFIEIARARETDEPSPLVTFDGILARRLALVGVISLISLEFGSRLMVSWE